MIPKCKGCEERQKKIDEWLAACKAWALKPFGPMPEPPKDEGQK